LSLVGVSVLVGVVVEAIDVDSVRAGSPYGRVVVFLSVVLMVRSLCLSDEVTISEELPVVAVI
jgi:hypothetical protein